MYRVCNAHAPDCHLWPTPLYNIFPHYLRNGKILGEKKVTENKMYILIFYANLSEMYLILRRNEPDMIETYMLVFK
jgi:hypothetical protein